MVGTLQGKPLLSSLVRRCPLAFLSLFLYLSFSLSLSLSLPCRILTRGLLFSKTLKQGSSAEFSCFTPRDCTRRQWNKPFLNTSIFCRCIESRCTEKNQARSMMTSTHASVRCSILVPGPLSRRGLEKSFAPLSRQHLFFFSLKR